jgi:hypothetical protein
MAGEFPHALTLVTLIGIPLAVFFAVFDIICRIGTDIVIDDA